MVKNVPQSMHKILDKLILIKSYINLFDFNVDDLIQMTVYVQKSIYSKKDLKSNKMNKMKTRLMEIEWTPMQPR